MELLTFFTLLPATLVARSFHAKTSGLDPSVLPLAVEVLAVMLVADLTQYAVTAPSTVSAGSGRSTLFTTPRATSIGWPVRGCMWSTSS